MALEAWIFFVALALSAALLFLTIFSSILHSDLERDYVNPIDMCSNLNCLLVPEYAAHGILSLCLLFSKPLGFAWNLPLLVCHARRIHRGVMFYDATEIFRTLARHKRETFAKLAFYLASFFVYLYWMVVTLVE